MKIEKMKVTELIPADYNPRKDSMPDMGEEFLGYG